MSAEQVAKLETLLQRVQSRRASPRADAAPPADDVAAVRAPVAAAAAAPAATPTPAKVAPVAAKAVPVPAPSRPKVAEPVAAAPPVAAPVIPPAAPTPVPTSAVASTPAAAPAVAKSVAPPADLEVEVEEGMAEVDLDGLDEGGELSDSVADLDTVAAGASKDEEELPASSRRPIQLPPAREELRDAAEAKAPHPAPPESRRQVAIPPAEFEGELKSGVRTMTEVAPVAAAAAAPAELLPDVTRPAAAATASPAVFRGAVPEVKPATFGELLDATLDL